MACLLAGCQRCICEGAPQDGPMSGSQVTIEDNLNRQVSVIFQHFLKTGNISAKKTAIEFRDNELTYQQLEEFSTSLAGDIRDRIGMDFKIKNPDKDPIICIIVPNSEKAIVLIMAILKTGAAYLPLDEEYPESLLLLIIKKFGPVLIIADDNGPVFNKHDPTKFSDISPLLTLEELWVAMDLPDSTLNKTKRRASINPQIIGVFPKPEKVTANPNTPYPAVILHTRGFQDNPSGVRISHESIINRCIFEWNTLHLKKKQSCSLTTILSQVDSVTQIFSALLKGCTLVIFRRTDIKNLPQFIRDVSSRHVNRLVIQYYHLRPLLQAIDDDKSGRKEVLKSLDRLKYVVCRGGYVHQDDVVRYFKMFKRVKLCNSNGSAETSGDMIYDVFTSARDFARKSVSGRICLGKVMQNTRVYILGSQLGVISDGHQGEVCVSGSACLALGYVDAGNAKEQKNNFVKNPTEDTPGYETTFRSGEFGRIVKCKDGKRRLYVEGRDDRVVKQKGHEFHVDDVKPYLAEFPFAQDVFLYVLNKGKPTQELVGLILIKSGTASSSLPDSITMERTLATKIPHWAIPDEIMLIKTIPKHYNNDPCPRCLIAEFRENREPRANSWERLLVVPQEKWNAGILLVKAIFKIASIPVEITIANLKHSFYEIGGTSLTTIPLLVYLNKKGYPISLKDFFTQKNLMELITLMSKTNPSLPKTGDDQVDEDESIMSKVDDVGGGAFVQKNFHLLQELKQTYTVEMLKLRHKSQVISIIATAYCEKGELASYNMVNYRECEAFLEELWEGYLQDELSIVITDNDSKKVIGVAMCQDFFKLVDTAKACGVMYNVMEFYTEVKGNILLFLPHRFGETLELSWMATHSSLSPQKNVKIITVLHTEIIKMARENFSGIFHSSANLLSRSLCTDVFGYDIYEDFQINKYQEFDGTRPFHLAGDTAACGALYLKLREPAPPSEATSRAVIDPVKYFNNGNRKRVSGVKYYHSNKSVGEVGVA